MIPLIQDTESSQTHRNRKCQHWLSCAAGREKGSLLFYGYRFSVWEDEVFWRRMVMMVAQQCGYT